MGLSIGDPIIAPLMKKAEAIAYFNGNVSALARAAEVDQSSVYSWGVYPPGGRQLLLERKTKGALKAEPGCMRLHRKGEKGDARGAT